MTCRDFVDLVIGYVEGELDMHTRARFDEHRAMCPDCPHYLTHYRETIHASAAACAEDFSLELPEELVRTILVARNITQTT